MIFITHTESCADLKLLSGVLLDEVREEELPRAVFRAFLSSGSTREINCEVPKFHGGLGSSRDGRRVSEFETHLFGVTTYFEDSIWRGLSEVAENRILLATDSDLTDLSYPAFLNTKPVSTPVETKVLIKLEPHTLGDLPDVRAFVLTERYLLGGKEIQEPIPPGIILPVTYLSSGRNNWAALVIRELGDQGLVHASVFHEARALPPADGAILVRNVSRMKPHSCDERIQFNAVIGTVKG